jgi:ubiquinone/menaquinone biosynthesis C-methylase UbiE
MNNYYDQISEGYEELHKEEQLKKVNLILQNIEIKKQDKLLDVGCGTGLYHYLFDCEVFGIDPAKKLLEKHMGNSKLELARAEEIPFEDESFDIVTSITAIQNFSDIKKGLEEIKRVGKQKFVLTALKKSLKIQEIEKVINELFKVEKRIEEDKDIIFIARKE